MTDLAPAADPLPSWNEGAARSAILDFVDRVTREGGPDFVPPAERIAVFDNDGTLWCEMPIPVQAAFVGARLKALAPEHPEWASTEPYRSALAGDLRALASQGIAGLEALVMATHAGMTTDEFERIVQTWLGTATHPALGVPYTRAVYQPMLELLRLLRDRGFSTFIVSGGGVEFMRVFAERTYGVPPQNVIGTTIRTHFEMRDGVPVLVRDPSVDMVDDKAGKPVSINRVIGRRPIACFGNSDSDREMLLWTTEGRTDGHPSLGLLVHHTDGEREFRYDREHVPSGHLERALDEAPSRHWVLADMRRDWRTVFPAGSEADIRAAPLAAD